MNLISKNLRTWIELDSRAAKHNYRTFRNLISSRVKLWAVVKSNAYGHGLILFSKLVERGVDGFCVDSLVEGIKLREARIKKEILVLGFTLPPLFELARAHNIAITISNFSSLEKLDKNAPLFHIKLDTGMHRQGFYPEEVGRVTEIIEAKGIKKKLAGVYTHFAAAKDINYPTYTEGQFKKFEKAKEQFLKAGFKGLVYHAAATGGTLVNKKYHLNAVRVGIGMYGLWPSRELEAQLPNIVLRPVLSWRAVIADIKTVNAGDYIGYDLTERILKPTRIAVIPIGYWHGFSRSLSGRGMLLAHGQYAKVLGRISMDMTTADIGSIKAHIGDPVTLIGRNGREELRADYVAELAGTSHYEFLTRLNPLIEKIII